MIVAFEDNQSYLYLLVYGNTDFHVHLAFVPVPNCGRLTC